MSASATRDTESGAPAPDHESEGDTATIQAAVALDDGAEGREDQSAAAGTDAADDLTGRCEAETEVGGTLYRCALQEEHDGEHSFTPLDAGDGEEAQPVGIQRQSASEQRKVQERLAAEAERHAKRIAEILGGDITGLVQCELCPPNMPGWRPAASPPQAVIDKVRVVLGLPDLTTFKASKWETECPACEGRTRVKTGSHDPRFETKPCDECDGTGYIATIPRKHDEQPPPPPVENGQPPQSRWDDGIQRDMFGTPITDPDYGKMPALRARPIEYWQTHAE